MEAATFVVIAIAIGLLVAIAIVRYRKTPPVMSRAPQETLAAQINVTDEIIKHSPEIKGFILEAKQDGATHAAYIADEDAINFYRTREGKCERRSLQFTPAPHWFWRTNWRNCKELPEYALKIPDNF